SLGKIKRRIPVIRANIIPPKILFFITFSFIYNLVVAYQRLMGSAGQEDSN
ncbi:MAG: hypothetical protein ACI9YB_003127, partial [Halioglobus sp.]